MPPLHPNQARHLCEQNCAIMGQPHMEKIKSIWWTVAGKHPSEHCHHWTPLSWADIKQEPGSALNSDDPRFYLICLFFFWCLFFSVVLIEECKRHSRKNFPGERRVQIGQTLFCTTLLVPSHFLRCTHHYSTRWSKCTYGSAAGHRLRNQQDLRSILYSRPQVNFVS